MRRGVIRYAALVIALLVFWLLLLAWAMRVSPTQSWSSPHTLQLPVAKVSTVFGDVEQRAGGMRISALGADALGLQTWRVDALKASDYGVLRYRFKHLPRNFSVDLIIRTAEHSRDVTSIPLPWPGEHAAAIDLTNLPQWHGTIIEIGFSEYASPQLVPPDAPFQPFTLVGASLQQPSWSSALTVLAADWFGYRSWRQSSINSLGEDPGTGARPLLLFVSIGALGSALLLWLVGRVPLRCSLTWVLVLAWLVLDGHWLAMLGERHAQTRAWYAGQPWPQRQHLQADRELVQGAANVKRILATEPPGRHLLVWAPTAFARGRLSYHLRPLNVGDVSAGKLELLAPGSVLLIDDDAGVWHYDAVSGVLRWGQERVNVQPLWHADQFQLFRVSVARGATP